MRVRVLYSANLHRLWKSWSFWLCGAGVLGYALWQVRNLVSWAYFESPAGPGVHADYLTSMSFPVVE